MSRIIAILLIILLLQFTPFVTKTQAASTCTSNDVQITYRNPTNGTTNENTFFTENSGDLIFEFKFNNINTLNQLYRKEVYLHFGPRLGIGFLGGAYDTDKVLITNPNLTSPTFLLEVNSNADQAKKGDMEGSLYWPDPDIPGQFKEFCSQVKYKVGSQFGKCRILDPQPPSEIQSNTPLTINFLGIANKKYQLNSNSTKLSEATTNSSGVGSFKDVIITGTTGETIRLVIYIPGVTSELSQCEKLITIKPTAPPPPTTNPSASINPVPNPTVVTCTGSNCSSGGGETCKDDGKGPAIKTAIGCIHTNPAELVKDLMTFIIAISGGLAFLMMLLGAFEMLTSSGNPESLNNGRSRLTSAVIGLLFVIFATLFMQVIGFDILKIPGFGK